jgi:TatD DNase family protein
MTDPPLLLDTHIHLDHPAMREDLARHVAEANKCGVSRFLLPGVTDESWDGLLAVTAATQGALAAPGIHPQAAHRWDSSCAERLSGLLERPEVVAVGEIGLDGYPGLPPMEVQESAFRAQLRLAVAAQRPVIIHCRKALGRLFGILKEEEAAQVGGIMHAFAGSVELARQAVEMNFALGFGGVLTYPNARRAPQVFCELPAEWLVLETDAPDMAPHPHRGETNRPAWLKLIACRAAELRGWSLEQTARITTANACRILNLVSMDNPG